MINEKLISFLENGDMIISKFKFVKEQYSALSHFFDEQGYKIIDIYHDKYQDADFWKDKDTYYILYEKQNADNVWKINHGIFDISNWADTTNLILKKTPFSLRYYYTEKLIYYIDSLSYKTSGVDKDFIRKEYLNYIKEFYIKEQADLRDIKINNIINDNTN